MAESNLSIDTVWRALADCRLGDVLGGAGDVLRLALKDGMTLEEIGAGATQEELNGYLHVVEVEKAKQQLLIVEREPKALSSLKRLRESIVAGVTPEELGITRDGLARVFHDLNDGTEEDRALWRIIRDI